MANKVGKRELVRELAAARSEMLQWVENANGMIKDTAKRKCGLSEDDEKELEEVKNQAEGVKIAMKVLDKVMLASTKEWDTRWQIIHQEGVIDYLYTNK